MFLLATGWHSGAHPPAITATISGTLTNKRSSISFISFYQYSSFSSVFKLWNSNFLRKTFSNFFSNSLKHFQSFSNNFFPNFLKTRLFTLIKHLSITFAATRPVERSVRELISKLTRLGWLRRRNQTKRAPRSSSRIWMHLDASSAYASRRSTDLLPE